MTQPIAKGEERAYFEEEIFDFHLRGCSFTPSQAQEICKERQHELVEKIVSLLARERQAGRDEAVDYVKNCVAHFEKGEAWIDFSPPRSAGSEVLPEV